MKYVLALTVMLLGCSVHHTSGDYACTTTSDCASDRICDNGFCVLKGSIDAPPTLVDAPRPNDGGNNGCPPGCTTCNVAQKTCTINCMAGANCSNTVTCPAGYKCDILCNTDNSCRNGINCQQGAGCNVECSGKQSCQNVQCGAGPCDVSCSGPSSCRGVSCSNSCACDVACTGNQACEGIQCTAFACRNTNGLGCTSMPLVCHSCTM